MQNICHNIKYIGTQDDNLDLFEGQYPINKGVSYNSYLIDDEKIAIIDSVDIRRTDDWLWNIGKALGQKHPSYIIVQHMEPDHSASLLSICRKYPELKIVCSPKAAAMIGNFFETPDLSQRIITVSDGDTLPLGQSTLKFLSAPMVHWPEVIVSFEMQSATLFSADAFGSFAMWDDTDAWDAEARRYYTNIVGRFGASVQQLLRKLNELPIKNIAPLHGPMLTGDLSRYIDLYDKWSRYEPEEKGVLVAYASIYGGTAEAARRIAHLLQLENAGQVVLMDLCRHHVSYAVAEAFRLDAMVLCSATYDGGLMPAMYNFLHHLEMKKLCRRRVGFVENGSWAPVAARLMAGHTAKMKDFREIAPVVTIKSRLHEADIPLCQDLAKAMAEK